MDNLAARDVSSQWVPGQTGVETPGSQTDLSSSGQREGTYTIGRVHQRLDALLLLLKDCKGRQCTFPWESYFPSGEVRSLAQALEPAYDAFFASAVTKVSLDECTKGYIPEWEGPQWDDSQVYAMVDEVWLAR